MAESGRSPWRSASGFGAFALVVAGLAAPLLAPHDPDRQFDPAGGQYRPPGTRLARVELADGRTLLADRVTRTASGEIRVERLGRSEELPPAQVTNATADGVGDHERFWLGTDGFSRDLLSRLLHGARVSLLVAFLAVGLSLSLGLSVGGLAALAPRPLAGGLTRLIDGFLAFPYLFLVIALAALFRPSTLLVALILGATGWMTIARLFRAELLGLAERDFVLAVRALGASPARLFFHHLLPNALSPVLVQTTLLVSQVILVEASLSFLGLGVQPPTSSWGNMIAEGRDVLTTAWWVSAFPGLALVLTAVAFNHLGDDLRDRLDPRAG
ncbi:MAG: ABC transporter permease [Thermoanaerobaculia bacterium]|nr:ABC transporter permease [Thermoanaerobaculia bacterium]